MSESKKHSMIPIEIYIIVAIIALLCAILIPSYKKEHQIGTRFICGTNLSGLGKAFLIYSDKYGAYPQPDKWSDVLLREANVTENYFKCPGNKKVRCGYSMNPNCKPNSEPNTVLLFDSKGGWNSFGGAELFDANHHEQKGGNILFNDGHAMFQKADPNMKLVEELNWGKKAKAAN